MDDEQSPDYCPLDGGPRIGTECGICGATLAMTGVAYEGDPDVVLVWTDGEWMRLQ